MKRKLLRQCRRSLSAILAAVLLCTSLPMELQTKAAEEEIVYDLSELQELLKEDLQEGLQTPEFAVDGLELVDQTIQVENESRVVVRISNLEAFGEGVEIHYTLNGEKPSRESALYDSEEGICVATADPAGGTIVVRAAAFREAIPEAETDEGNTVSEGNAISEGNADGEGNAVSEGNTISEGNAVSEGDTAEVSEEAVLTIIFEEKTEEVSQGDPVKLEETTDTTPYQPGVSTYEGTYIDPVEGVYVLTPSVRYCIELKGAEGYVSIAVAELTDCEETQATIAYTYLEDGSRAVDFTATEDLAGKSFQVVLYADDDKTEELETIAFKVASHLTSVTVEGVQDGLLTQYPLTRKEYSITRKETDSLDQIGALLFVPEEIDVDEESVEVCDFSEEGKLIIETTAFPGNRAATVYVYNEAFLTNPLVGKPENIPEKAVLCKFDITVSEYDWQNKPAQIKQLKASDTNVYVEITSPTGQDITCPSKVSFDYEVAVGAIEPTREGCIVGFVESITPDRDIDDTTYCYQAKVARNLRLFDRTVKTGDGGAQAFRMVVTPRLNVGGNYIYGKSSEMIISTVDSYFPEKLKLKTTCKQLYTGQECKIAELDYGKNNSCIDDSMYEVTSDNEKVEVYLNEGSIYAYAMYSDRDTSSLGKTTITVECDLTELGLPPVFAKTTIQVLQGIEDIELIVPREEQVMELYKQPGKALKLNTKILYNHGESTPKTKKVRYALGHVEDDAFVEDKTVLDGAVKISTSGVITVQKDYKLKENPDQNRFAVAVFANDYKESDESCYAEIQLTEETSSMGEPVLTYGSDSSFHIVETPSLAYLMASEIKVRVLKPGVDTSKTSFSEEDLANVQYTTSIKKNKFIVMSDDCLELKSTQNLLNDKFVVTVTSLNGSKESKTLTFQIETLQYKDPRVYILGKTLVPLYTSEEDEVKEQKGINKAPVSDHSLHALFVGDGKGAGSEAMDQAMLLSDYKISVKGGKLVYDIADLFEEEYGIKVQKNKLFYVRFTSPKMTVTLTNLKGKKIAQYVVEDESLSKQTITPKITVVKNTLPSTGYKGDQEITFTVDKKTMKLLGDQNVSLVPAVGEISTEDFIALSDASAPVDKETGQATLKLEIDARKQTKGKLLFYLINTDTKEMVTKYSSLVTIQAVKLKKSFKLNASHSISTSSTEGTMLNAKVAGVQKYEYLALYNASSKGAANKFTSLFALSGNDKLKLREGIDAELLKDKKNLTGYVYCRVVYLDGTQEFTFQKTTIKLTK